MQNIKSKGDKFLVEIKNDQGDYEPLGVLSFHEAVEVSFTTHHAIRMQKVCGWLDEGEWERVGKQLFTKGELRNALRTLRNILLTNEKEGLEHFCEHQWGEFPLDLDGNCDGDIERTIAEIPSMITEGNLEVYYNDFALRQADPVEHGIWIKDGKITKVY